MLKSVLKQMEDIFCDHPHYIEHTYKVLAEATAIMDGEAVSQERELVSLAAALHDIGLVAAQEKYGSTAGPWQEMEGARIAREVLSSCGYTGDSERIIYIVGHHHTKEKVDGLDFQIIWEADLLVNLAGKKLDAHQLEELISDNFKTETGQATARLRFS
jgi:response regulator RpfG family c-di-GMP phosphodiesterase